MIGMGRYANGYFDLAIVDPPYGIGEDGRKGHSRGKLAVPADYRARSRYDDAIPDAYYFAELCRVSKNQIIWGGNYFLDFLPSTKETRIHPNHKPIALYKWLLSRYSKGRGYILDTHLGSQSSRIAAFDMGFNFVVFELDPDYYASGNRRFAEHVAQGKLFDSADLYTTGPEY